MFETFKADFQQHQLSNTGRTEASLGEIAIAFFEMSLWAIGIFRFGKWAKRLRLKIFRWPLMLLYFVLYKLSQALSGIRISLASEIGPGLVIHNFGGVIIHGQVGRNCIFVQGAQMVSRSDGKGDRRATLGDGVYVSAGAKIVGSVVIGDHARIGANAVVLTDVPAGALVMPPECRMVLCAAAAAAGETRAEASRQAAPAPAVQNGDRADDLRRRIVELLEQKVCRDRKFPVGDSESMLENGLVDSLGILQLADAIAARFGITVEPDDLMPGNLDSVAAIVGFVRRKRPAP